MADCGRSVVSSAALHIRQSALGNRRFRPAYSFAEILFAVAVLGVGFIMVAALFPVGIHQSKTTAEETAAATLARSAVAELETIATDANMPPTDDGTPADPAQVRPFVSTSAAPILYHGSWDAVRGSLIVSSDPRYAFVPLYRREEGENFAQIWVIAVESREAPRYDTDDISMGAAGYPDEHADLQPRPIQITITNDGAAPGIDQIDFADVPAGLAGAMNSVAEGSFVVVAGDPGVDNIWGTADDGVFNGQVYRVGARRSDLDPDVLHQSWELMPGSDYDMIGAADIGADSDAYIIGRGMTDSGDPTQGYAGVAQDIAVYTTVVRVR
jgi:hypothetical protein